jgi:polysaccharide pyruvyl transferase WcaK-like protein
MRILLDGSSYALWNVGDAAMLQISVARLRKLWSSATIQVLCASPERLSRYVPDAQAVPSNGQRKWLEWSRFPGRDRVPSAIAHRVDSRFRDRLPNLSDGLAFRRAKGHPTDRTDIEAFLHVADSADLLVLSGGGYMTDVFRGHAASSLELLSRFQRRGAPTAMVGQGIGPLRDRTLLARARATLPRVGLLALREGRAALPFLDTLGVPRERIRVTGDDAIEPALAARPDRLGTSLGVNVRVSSYSRVGRDLFGELRTALRRAADSVGAALLPVPISSAPADSDVESLREFLPGGGAGGGWPDGLDTPLTVIRRIGECRVVVTGSYHAGVFALSQGIPVVGLSRSDYYTDKFLGLADQFGSGCRLVSLDEPLNEALPARIIELWREAEALRPDLLAAASRQVEEGREAYALLGLLTGSPSELPSDTPKEASR